MRTALGKSFELKIRGRIGIGVEGSNDMRILNRVVEVKEDGINYESDPRHVDILLKSLGLTSANSVLTPGVKEPSPDLTLVKTADPKQPIPIDDADSVDTSHIHGDVTRALQTGNSFGGRGSGLSGREGHSGPCESKPRTDDRTVGTALESKIVASSCLKQPSAKQLAKSVNVQGSLHSRTTFHEVTPYSEIYGAHPSVVMSTDHGLKYVSTRSDPFTCKGGDVMKLRHAQHFKTKNMKHIEIYRSLVVQNQSSCFTDAFTNLIHTTIAKGHSSSGQLDKANLNKVMARIHMLDCKHDRRMAFDATGELTASAFSVVPPKHRQPAAKARIKALLQESLKVDGDIGTTTTHSTLDHTYQRLCAARTPPAKKHGPARQGAKKAKSLERLQSTGDVLDPEEATAYRALSARANYLAQDRPDIAYATKELCREFSRPTKDSYAKLKRVVRYLAGTHRLVYNYKFLDAVPETIDVYCDTDFAGCQQTRRSTSGGVAMIGSHNVKHWSKTQTTVSLSSGEAELHGICAGVAQGLGLQQVLKDLGFDYKLRVFSDATAAIGIARRRGMGKIRHLDCSDLWVQEKIRNKQIALHKVLGTENPADAFTKYVNAETLKMAMSKIGMQRLDGRPACAPDTLGI